MQPVSLVLNCPLSDLGPRRGYIKVHSTLPRTLRDWYQNVPQDVNFDILDVPKKITLAKFGFLTIFVQPRDEKWSISGMGGRDA